MLTEKLDTLCPEIVVQPSTGKAFADADSMTAAVRRTEGVAVATPTITDNALALYGAHEMPVTLKGVVPADYSKTTAIRYILLEGSRYIDAEDSMPGTLLSIGSAMKLGARELDSGLLLFAPPARRTREPRQPGGIVPAGLGARARRVPGATVAV